MFRQLINVKNHNVPNEEKWSITQNVVRMAEQVKSGAICAADERDSPMVRQADCRLTG